VNKKRESREFCFQYFFHLQLPIFSEEKNATDEKSIKESIQEFQESTNTLLGDEFNTYVFKQIKNTMLNYSSIEAIIEKYLKNWKLNRISRVDHTTLLLAVNELCFDKDTPVGIIINEAIEISKKFGSEESASFVNGILDNIAKNELNE